MNGIAVAGMRDGSWQVGPPAEEVPPELPEPCLGINFARDGMPRRDWLALVAVHSDTWLLAVAFYYGVKLDVNGRAKLFRLINQGPTLFEVVTNRVGSAGRGTPGAGNAAPPVKKQRQVSGQREWGRPWCVGVCTSHLKQYKHKHKLSCPHPGVHHIHYDRINTVAPSSVCVPLMGRHSAARHM